MNASGLKPLVLKLNLLLLLLLVCAIPPAFALTVDEAVETITLKQPNNLTCILDDNEVFCSEQDFLDATQEDSWFNWQPKPKYGPGSEKTSAFSMFGWSLWNLHFEIRFGIYPSDDRWQMLREENDESRYPLYTDDAFIKEDPNDLSPTPSMLNSILLEWGRVVYVFVTFN